MEPEDPEPPSKNYGFKDREFKRDNPPASELPPAPTAKDHAIMAGHFAARKPPAPSGGASRAADPNDVHAILQQNHAVAKQAGLNEVELKVVKSRRKRDFWLLLIAGNLVTAGLVALGGFNPISLVYGLAGVVVLSLGLTWIMWFVMDDY